MAKKNMIHYLVNMVNAATAWSLAYMDREGGSDPAREGGRDTAREGVRVSEEADETERLWHKVWLWRERSWMETAQINVLCCGGL